MALKPITDFASQILKPYINNQDKAYAANIAPVETSPATAAHTAGTQLIYNGVLYDVTADIAANDVLATTGAGANISAADKVTEQISAQKQALSNEVATRATLGTHNIFPFVYSLDTWIDAGCTKAESSGVVTYTATDAYARVGYWYPNVLEVGKKYVINFKKKCTFSANAIRLQFATTQTMTTSDPSMFKVFEYTTSDADYVEETYEFTATSTDLMFGVYVQAGSGTGNVIAIKEIQITLATDAKTGYSPYVPTNSQLLSYKNNGVLGAKNFWPNGNVTFVRQNSYDLNYAMSGNYILSADVISTDTDDTTCLIYDSTNQTILGYIPRGTQKSVQITLNNTLRIALYASTNYTTSEGDTATFANVMIRLASDTDPTYQPYAMTNQELTNLFTVESGTTSISQVTWKRFGKIVYVSVKAYVGTGSRETFTGLPTAVDYGNAVLIKSGSTDVVGVIESSGTINAPVNVNVYGSLVYMTN